jgi:hypothetical protein
MHSLIIFFLNFITNPIFHPQLKKWPCFAGAWKVKKISFKNILFLDYYTYTYSHCSHYSPSLNYSYSLFIVAFWNLIWSSPDSHQLAVWICYWFHIFYSTVSWFFQNNFPISDFRFSTTLVVLKQLWGYEWKMPKNSSRFAN